MDNLGHNADGQGSKPNNSLLDVFGNLFSWERSASAGVQTPVLTSFKDLSDDTGPLEEGCETFHVVESELTWKQHLTQGDKVPFRDAEERPGKWDVLTEAGSGVKAEQSRAADKDLVLVSRVETYTDTESEEEKDNESGPNSSVLSGEPSLPPEGEDALDHREGLGQSDAAVFTTDPLKGRPSVGSLDGSGEGGVSGPCESNTPMFEDVKTDGSTKTEGAEDDSEGIDCSLPLPTIISGHLGLDASGPDSDQTRRSATCEDSAEGPDGSHISSVPIGPRAPEVSVQSRLSPLSEFKVSPAPPKTPDTSPPAPSSHSPNTLPLSRDMSSPPSFQMPALFSGLRVLKKGAVGEERETLSEIKQSEKDAELALLSLKTTVNKTKLLPEHRAATAAKKSEAKPIAQTKNIVMGQLSHLFNLDLQRERRKPGAGQEAALEHDRRKEKGGEVTGEENVCPETSTSPDIRTAGLKSVFGPKAVKKDKIETVDLEAVRKKIKSDKENLRSIFERTSKTPSKELRSSTESNVCTRRRYSHHQSSKQSGVADFHTGCACCVISMSP